MRWSIVGGPCVLAAAAAAVLLLIVPASAQMEPSVVRVDDAVGQAVESTTAASLGRASVTLRNSGGAASRVLVGTEFRHSTSTATSAAEWIKLPGGERPGDPGFMLRAGETATFEVSGLLGEAGVYETFIQVEGTGTLRFPIRITRVIEAVPGEFLLEPRPVRVGLGILHTFVADSPFLVRLTGVNASNQPVELMTPIVGPILRVEGDASSQAASATAPSINNGGCDGVILARQPCAIEVALPAELGPGSYSFEVMVPGAGGGQSSRTVRVDVRASPWLAGIVVALGVALGALVTDWRNSARPAVSGRIEAARARDEAQRLARAARSKVAGARARKLAAELLSLDEEALEGRDVAAQAVESRKRVETLDAADRLLVAAAEPQGEAAGIFAEPEERLANAIEAATWDDAAIAAAMKTLGRELAGFRGLLQAAARFDRIAGSLAEAVQRCGAGAVRDGWNEAAALREEAFAPIAGTEGGQTATTIARAGRLEEAASSLSRLRDAIPAALGEQLAKRLSAAAASSPDLKPQLDAMDERARALATSSGSSEDRITRMLRLFREFEAIVPSAATEGVSGAREMPITEILPEGSSLSFGFSAAVYQPAAGASAADLQRSIRVWDWVTNLVALAGIAAVGVLVLWMTNTAWGTVQDVILALLSGAGTRLAIGTIALPGART